MIYQYKIKKRLSDADIFAVWQLVSGNWCLATGNWKCIDGGSGGSGKVRKVSG